MHNPLLYIHKYKIKYVVLSGEIQWWPPCTPPLRRRMTDSAAVPGRERGWSTRLSPDCQYLPIVPAADDG